MTRAEAKRQKRRRRLKRQAQYIGAWTLVFAFELLVAAAPTAIVAAILIPITYQQRGGFAVGGEWMVMLFLFCAVFSKIHRTVYDRIYGEEE